MYIALVWILCMPIVHQYYLQRLLLDLMFINITSIGLMFINITSRGYYWVFKYICNNSWRAHCFVCWSAQRNTSRRSHHPLHDINCQCYCWWWVRYETLTKSCANLKSDLYNFRVWLCSTIWKWSGWSYLPNTLSSLNHYWWWSRGGRGNTGC